MIDSAPPSQTDTRPSLGREIRETVRLALPISLSQIGLMTMGLVDVAIVGRVSSVSLAAVSLGNSLVFACVCPAMGISMAVEPLASQAIGANDPDKAREALRAGVLASLLLTVPSIAAGLASTMLLDLVGVPEEVAKETRMFMLARLPGVAGWLLFMVAKSFLEAEGRIAPLLWASWVTNVVNFVACGLLVLGDGALTKIGLPPVGLPTLGVVGAGLATSVSNGMLAVWALHSAFRTKGPPVFENVRAFMPQVKAQIRIGVPIGLQVLTEVGVFSLAGLLAGRLGPTITSAHQIAIGIASFSFMGVLGVGGATAVRVGRRVGQGSHQNARRAGLVGIAIGLGYMAISAGVIMVSARGLSALFSPDLAVIELAIPLLYVAAAFQIFDGIQGVAGGALRGVGDTRFASYANIACHWGIGLPLACVFTFALGKGVFGLWWGLGIGIVVVAGALFARFLNVTSRPIARL